MPDDDFPEVVELEEAAAWRLRQVDADPSDGTSVEAARALQALADELRTQPDVPLLRELRALCNWLGESDNILDYAARAHEFRKRIGVDVHVDASETYLRMLIELAKDAM